MAGKCKYCGFVGTNDEMEKHAGEMCQGDFQPDDIEQNLNSLQLLQSKIAELVNEHTYYCRKVGGNYSILVRKLRQLADMQKL